MNAVIISTRHNTHAKIAIDAINKKKHVLVEKPMGTTEEECKQVLGALKKNKVVYSVGFNRNYSPLTKQIKNYIQGRTYPLFINYRVNTRLTTERDWTNDPIEGGGRIIGEMCHMYSFFNYIIGSPLVDIQANKIESNGQVIDYNNVITTIKYKDGSIASLFYTDYGNDNLSKERIEIFGGGNAIVLNDFERLDINGKITQIKQNKGHYNELVEFKKKIKGEPSDLIDATHAFEVMNICFRVSKLLRNVN